MKVNDFLKKIDYIHTDAEVILKDIDSGKERKADSFDFSGKYYYDEKQYTVEQIQIKDNKVYVYYKNKCGD